MTSLIIDTTKEYRGKIIKVVKRTDNPNSNGWGFITSRDIPYRRIFFHWTGLKQETIHFEDLKKGMEVMFFVKDNGEDKGLQALKIDVLEDK